MLKFIISWLILLGLLKSAEQQPDKGDAPKTPPDTSAPANGSKTPTVTNSNSTRQSGKTIESNSGNKFQELEEEMPSTDSKEPSPLSEHTDAKDLLNDLKDENTELNSSESNENKSTKMRDDTEVSDNTKTDNESSNFSDSSNTPPPDDDFQD